MTDSLPKYDVAIVGGGLGGLSLSILLRRAGYHVVLFEKESYPFHRVCGEYLSMESVGFLKRLGLGEVLDEVPRIHRLRVSAPDGSILTAPLPLGGIGISRYRLDNLLATAAKQCGVHVLENSKVESVCYTGDGFQVQAGKNLVSAKVCAGSYGKRSNLDNHRLTGRAHQRPGKLNNFIGIKYHIRFRADSDTIFLHNFEQGYCGMSEIESGMKCLCYLTTADNLMQAGHSIPALEKNILSRNPHLKQIFSEAEFLFERPVTISQISFRRKPLLYEHVLHLGDAAGMIAPLCGNGMSMALRAALLASEHIVPFLQGDCDRLGMEAAYQRSWSQQFSARLLTGRVIQSFFGKSMLTNLFLQSLRPFPGAVRFLIQQTHGAPF